MPGPKLCAFESVDRCLGHLFLPVERALDSNPGLRSALGGRLELPLDPLFDVATPEAEVSADSESGWPEASVAPGVDRVHRHVQVAGEILGAEQFIESLHRHIVDRVGVDEITDSCQALLAKGLRRIRHR